MKFQVLRFLSLILYMLLRRFIPQHQQLLRSYIVYQMNEWVWSIGRMKLTAKIKTFRDKLGPVLLCPPQIPYGLAYKWTQEAVVRGPGLTVTAIYLRWVK
jgi:hypothetical protein